MQARCRADQHACRLLRCGSGRAHMEAREGVGAKQEQATMRMSTCACESGCELCLQLESPRSCPHPGTRLQQAYCPSCMAKALQGMHPAHRYPGGLNLLVAGKSVLHARRPGAHLACAQAALVEQLLHGLRQDHLRLAQGARPAQVHGLLDHGLCARAQPVHQLVHRCRPASGLATDMLTGRYRCGQVGM